MKTTHASFSTAFCILHFDPHELETHHHHALSSPPCSPSGVKFPFCPRRKAQGSHHRRVGRRVRRRGGRRLERMGQETLTLFPSLRFHQVGSLSDPRRDDEAPRRSRHRIRQAPIWGSPESGVHIFLITPPPFVVFFCCNLS